MKNRQLIENILGYELKWPPQQRFTCICGGDAEIHITKGVWECFECGAKGGIPLLYAMAFGCNYKIAQLAVLYMQNPSLYTFLRPEAINFIFDRIFCRWNRSRHKETPKSLKLVDESNKNLLDKPYKLEICEKLLGITEGEIKKKNIGVLSRFETSWTIVPIYEHGELKDITLIHPWLRVIYSLNTANAIMAKKRKHK